MLTLGTIAYVVPTCTYHTYKYPASYLVKYIYFTTLTLHYNTLALTNAGKIDLRASS